MVGGDNTYVPPGTMWGNDPTWNLKTVTWTATDTATPPPKELLYFHGGMGITLPPMGGNRTISVNPRLTPLRRRRLRAVRRARVARAVFSWDGWAVVTLIAVVAVSALAGRL